MKTFVKMNVEDEGKPHSSEIWRDIAEPNYGYITVAVSTIFFYILSEIALFLTPLAVQKSSSSWRWKNISISLFHSFTSSIWALLCFRERPDMAEDFITVYTPLSHILVSYSVGYFVYDLCDLLKNQRNRQSYELVGHHTVIITCFMVAVWSRHYVGYSVVALMVEWNSIFLHIRQLLQIFGVSKLNPWYRLNRLINLGTFIACRILLLAWMTRWIVINRNVLPLVFYSLGSVGLSIMVAMNIILFYRLLCSDFISHRDTDSTFRKLN